MNNELPQPILPDIVDASEPAATEHRPFQPLPASTREAGANSQASIPVAHQKPVELISWVAPNRHFDEKPVTWFLGLFASGLILTVIFAVFREITLILVTAGFIFVFYALARVRPTDVEHRIMNVGIETGGRLYSWADLKSFWVMDGHHPVMLRVDTKMLFPHVLELIVPDDAGISSAQLEHLVLPYLPQQEQNQPQAGAMANTAVLSVANLVPYQTKVLSWLSKRLNLPTQPQV